MALSLEYKPDADEAMKRVDAFWKCAIIDRPCIQIIVPKKDARPLPDKTHTTHRDRWLDVEFNVERGAAQIANRHYIGELFPAYCPNLGPEIVTAAYGSELNFTESTSWSEPILDDWSGIDALHFDPDNVYVKTIMAMTKLSLEMGEGKFLTGHTDLHPGGDLGASIRDPQQFCMDLIMYPDEVKQLMQRVHSAFWDFYTLQYDMMTSHGQTVTTAWLPLYADGKYYIPSNDFSCMISTTMFKEFFLGELIDEIQWLDRSIYHLDGPDALKHLDTLLEIPELNAIQWVYGAGQGRASDWLKIYRRIQAAGKGMHISVAPDEIDIFMDNLSPEGVMLKTGAKSLEQADAIIQKISTWTKKK